MNLGLNIVKAKASARDGMTLTEAIIAVLILAVFMTGVSALIVQSGKTVDMAREHFTAVTLCRNRMEAARSLGFDTLSTLNETNYVCTESGALNSDGKFSRSTRITGNYMSSTNLAEIVVTVAIKDRITLAFSGESESVESVLTRY